MNTIVLKVNVLYDNLTFAISFAGNRLENRPFNFRLSWRRTAHAGACFGVQKICLGNGVQQTMQAVLTS